MRRHLRQHVRRRDGATALTVAVTVATLVALVWLPATAQLIAVGGGCGYDGAVYCAMFSGQPADPPFGRRILAPWLASLLGDQPVPAFRLLNLLCCAACAVLAGSVVASAARSAGRPVDVGARRRTVLLVVCGVLLTRNLLHFVLAYPAITDPLALTLLLAGVYALVELPDRPAFSALLAVSAFAAPLARETFGVPLAVGVAVSALAGRLSWWRAALLAGCAALGTVVAFTRVSASSPQSLVHVEVSWLEVDVGTPSQLARFALMLAIGLGFAWLPFVVRRWREVLGAEEHAMLAMVASLLAVSVFGGGDTDRIVMPAGVLLLLVVGRASLRLTGSTTVVALLVLAYGLAQAPFTLVGASADSWGSYFDLRLTSLGNLFRNGAVPVALALVPVVWVVLGLRRQSRTRSSPGETRRPQPGESASGQPAAARRAETRLTSSGDGDSRS